MAIEQDWAAYANQGTLGATDTILARTAAGAGVEIPGSALVRLDALGNVGIGTSTPSAKLHVVGDVLSDNSYILGSNANGWGRFVTASGALYIQAGSLNSGSAVAQPIVFANMYGGASRMIIRGDGSITTGSAITLATVQNGNFQFCHSGAEYGIVTNNRDSSGAVQTSLGFVRNGAYVGAISTTSTATAYNTSSDYRLKDDLKPLEGALDRILALPVYDFRWKDTGTRTRGFMAHEYGAVVPGGATGIKDGMREEAYEIEPERESDILGPDGVAVVIPAVMGTRLVPDYQGIDQSKVTPDLVGAVQELAAIIDELRVRIATLEAAL